MRWFQGIFVLGGCKALCLAKSLGAKSTENSRFTVASDSELVSKYKNAPVTQSLRNGGDRSRFHSDFSLKREQAFPDRITAVCRTEILTLPSACCRVHFAVSLCGRFQPTATFSVKAVGRVLLPVNAFIIVIICSFQRNVKRKINSRACPRAIRRFPPNPTPRRCDSCPCRHG